jgi:DHA1 family tetracycline resistance protein-like MFS transporter
MYSLEVKRPIDPSSRGMLFIFITLLIDVMGFGLIIPITPQLIQQLSHLSVSASAVPYAELQTLYGVMQFIFAPVLGSLSDRYGRRPVLLGALLCGGIDMAFLAVSPSIGWLFVGRTISGIAGASFTAASAYIADISPPEKRAQNFGIIGAAFGIGFVVGPVLGGVLGNIDLRLPFWAGFALSMGNFAYGYFILPESLSAERRRPFDWREANTFGSLRFLWQQRTTAILAVMLLLSGLAQQFLQSTWILYTQYRFSWSTQDNGIALGVIGLCVGGVQAGLSRSIIPRIGEPAALMAGLALTSIGFLGFGLAFASWMLYGTIIVWSLGALAGPAGQSIVSGAFGPDRQGAVQGALMSIQSVCMVFGPGMAGVLFAFTTSSKRSHPLPGAVFFVAAGLTAIAFVLSAVALRGRPPAARIAAA